MYFEKESNYIDIFIAQNQLVNCMNTERLLEKKSMIWLVAFRNNFDLSSIIKTHRKWRQKQVQNRRYFNS